MSIGSRQLELLTPQWLIALLGITLLIYVARHSRRSLRDLSAARKISPLSKSAGEADDRDSSLRQRAALACRLAVAGLLILAAAQPVYHGMTAQQFAVLVVDTSSSVADSKSSKNAQYLAATTENAGRHQACEVVFAGEAALAAQPAASVDEHLDRLASDPSSAVLLARALCPPQRVPRLVLLTDGNQTRGNLLGTAIGLDAPIDVATLTPFAGDEVCVVHIAAPATARPGSTIDLEVLITSNISGAGVLALAQVTGETVRHDVQLKAGENSIHFERTMPLSGRLVVRATLEGFSDSIQANNQRTAVVYPDRRPPVLLVEAQLELAQLQSQALEARGYDATIVPIDQLPTSIAELDRYDGVLLAGVVNSSLSDDQLAALERYVQGGGGLLMVGGEKSFGEAAFRQTALEKLMPVAAAEAIENRQPNTALVLVIDKSGSMRREDRMELAKSAAKQSITLLSEKDQVGVIAFGDDSPWVSQLVPGSEKNRVVQQISTITASGATNMYPAIQKAFLALELADADRKHMIVLTDGIPSPGDFHRLARQIAAANISMSTVSVGKGADQMILQDIAALAGGEHHHCDDPTRVPQVLVEATRRATAPTSAAPFRPFVVRHLPGMPTDSAPSLADHAETNPKPHAELVLITPQGAPLLSWWRYGAGATMALTSDTPRGTTTAWQNWPELAEYWDRLVSTVVRPSRPRDYHIEVSTRNNDVTVTVDIVDEQGRYVDGAPVEWKLTQAEDTSVQHLTDEPTQLQLLPQIAPGRYQVNAVVAGPGIYELQLNVAHNQLAARDTRAVVIDYPEELRLVPPNDNLLQVVAQTTGGNINPPPEQMFHDDGRRAGYLTVLWPWLALAAAFLFVADVGIRRWRIQ